MLTYFINIQSTGSHCWGSLYQMQLMYLKLEYKYLFCLDSKVPHRTRKKKLSREVLADESTEMRYHSNKAQRRTVVKALIAMAFQYKTQVNDDQARRMWLHMVNSYEMKSSKASQQTYGDPCGQEAVHVVVWEGAAPWQQDLPGCDSTNKPWNWASVLKFTAKRPSSAMRMLVG